MHVLTLNVGNVSYSKHSIPLIKRLCEHNKIPLTVLDKDLNLNIHKLHPAWLKCFCHKIVKSDFIIMWDLDLLPTRIYDLHEVFDCNKLNMVRDITNILSGNVYNGKFRYNTGLMGIPKSYGEWFSEIYFEKGPNSLYPSYEQYHVNDKIFDNKIEVKELDEKYNTMYNGIVKWDSMNVHYTYGIRSERHRYELIREHFQRYMNIRNVKYISR